MIDTKYPLRNIRKQSPLRQQDVAALLGMEPSNLVRYENGDRNPTPELLLTYHFLFDASLKDLFLSIYGRIADNLKERIQCLSADLHAEHPSKSSYKLSFLDAVVNGLSQINEDGSNN